MKIQKYFKNLFEPPVGFEPTTCSLQVSCTSHCAMEAFSHFLYILIGMWIDQPDIIRSIQQSLVKYLLLTFKYSKILFVVKSNLDQLELTSFSYTDQFVSSHSLCHIDTALLFCIYLLALATSLMNVYFTHVQFSIPFRKFQNEMLWMEVTIPKHRAIIFLFNY